MDYKSLQETYQGKYKERMQRQALVGKNTRFKKQNILILIVNPNASGEEVERMIESGNNQQLFSGQVSFF